MSEAAPESVDPRTYNAFVRGVDLDSVVLAAAQITSGAARPNARSTKVKLGADITLDSSDERGFTALAVLTASFDQADETLGTITASFRLAYRSAEPITEPILREFGQRNVRANVWPYAREFIQSMTQRMGWPSFVLPVSTSPKLRPPYPTTGGSSQPAGRTMWPPTAPPAVRRESSGSIHDE